MSLESSQSSTVEFLSAEDYVQPSRVILMHSLPRFGHDSNFAKIASSNQDEQADYVVGILAASFFILSLFIFWAAAIMSCKCMGKRRIGFLSGRMHLQPDSKGRFRPPMYLWKLRYTFMLLCCCIIGCALMLAMPATRSVLNASKSSQKIHREIKDLTDQGLLIVADLDRVKRNVNALDIKSVLQVEKLCPNYNKFLSDKSVNDSLNLINQEFDEMDNLLGEIDFDSVRNGIGFVKSGTNSIDIASRVVQDNDWMVKMYVLILDVMVVFMLLAASEIIDKKARINPALQMMVSVFIFPVFVVCVIIAVAAAVAFAVIGTANSDFCAVGPEVTVSNILKERGLIQGSMIYDTFEYYQSGCKTTDPMALYYDYEKHLQSGIASASDFIDRFNEVGMEEMTEQCGANVRPLVEVVSVLRDNLGILLGALRSTFEATSCSRVSPIYKQAFNANACEESASGLTLMFMIIVTIAAIGMVMIMLRSAMHPYRSVKRNPYLDQVENEKMTEYEEYKSYVGYMSEFVNMWKTKNGEDDSSEPTAAWSGSMESRSEEEKPLSPTTPAINWENHVDRPASFQLSPGGEECGVKEESHRTAPSSLMFSPNEGSARNFFNMRSPLSWSSNKLSPSSQILSDEYEDDEEKPLSPETPAISWDNDWENQVNTRLNEASPLSLGENGGRMMLSPRPDEINDKALPLSPETPALTWDNKATPTTTCTVSNDEEELAVARSTSIPSLHSGSFSEAEADKQPGTHSSNDAADSLLAVSFLGAVHGSPAPNSIRKQKKKTVAWNDGGEHLDSVPSLQDDHDEESTRSPFINWGESPSPSFVSSRMNTRDAVIDEDDGLEREGTSFMSGEASLTSPTSFKESPSNGNDEEERFDGEDLFDENPLSPETSLIADKSHIHSDMIRSRVTPKAQSTWNDDDEADLLTPQGRDEEETVRGHDQEPISGERSTSKLFNAMRFGTPDFLSPLRRDSAREYKKID